MNKKHIQIIIVLTLITLGFISRLLPHPANFAPIGAIALFCGMYLPRKWSIVAPIAALFVSDLIIGLYNPKMMIAVYLSFAIMVVCGHFAHTKKTLARVAGVTTLGSILFFLITNAAVWLFGTMYPPTLAGLIQSYEMAIPFFRNSFMADIFYVGILVGSAELAMKQIYKKMEAHKSAA